MALINTLHLIGSPDTNKVMMGELSRLARRGLGMNPPAPKKQGRGGLIYPFDPDLAALALGYQRTVTRVLWDRYESRASRLEPLYDDLLDDICGDTRPWYWDGARISVQARNVDAFAAGARQIVGTVKNAVLDGAKARGCRLVVDPHEPEIHLVARMHDDVITVSLDLAGRSLSRRGYRQAQGPAPIREHLAAVLCMLARYNPRTEILVDPMCGSGTICIEAALMAIAAPLGSAHSIELPQRQPELRDSKAAALEGPLFADTRPLIIGNDMDRLAGKAARQNAEAAGVADSVMWLRGDVRALSPERVQALAASQNREERTGLILSNPPYGHRLADPELTEFYASLGDWCSQFRGWRAAFLVGNPAWVEAFGHRPRVQKPLKNGPISGYFYLYDL
jgi:23S rRNA G2445 N2-methylase RlmL